MNQSDKEEVKEKVLNVGPDTWWAKSIPKFREFAIDNDLSINDIRNFRPKSKSIRSVSSIRKSSKLTNIYYADLDDTLITCSMMEQGHKPCRQPAPLLSPEGLNDEWVYESYTAGFGSKRMARAANVDRLRIVEALNRLSKAGRLIIRKRESIGERYKLSISGYLNRGLTIKQISIELNLTYRQVQDIITGYDLRNTDETSTVGTKASK